jgi:hypothetical protein
MPLNQQVLMALCPSGHRQLTLLVSALEWLLGPALKGTKMTSPNVPKPGKVASRT